jgi:pilus assembly protein CpaE
MAEKILIIDDDIDTLKLVGLMLERQGYLIAVASSGEQGLARAADEKPDLILLDIMMPDMDGYEVTRRLRANPAVSEIPIIMFTAKSMLDDKVAGFESGADDYLTKPTHPAELTAHVKAILSRTQKKPVKPTEKGKVIGFLGTRGGLGTSTLAINVGIALQQSDLDTIVAELNPGRATLALELNISDNAGLQSVLSRPVKEINLRSVESEVVSHETGVRLLLASHQAQETLLQKSVAQMEATVRALSSLCNVAVLDLGSGMKEYVRPLLALCDHIFLVVEPIFPSNEIALAILGDLAASGINRENISLILITRMRTNMMIPWREVETEMGIELAGVIPPAAEQAQHASRSGKPLLATDKKSVVATQIQNLAQNIAQQLSITME